MNIPHNQMRVILIVLVVAINGLLLNCSPIMANDNFKSLTINDGLAHTDANCVVQDSTGLIWIGTNSGLQSFDGYQFQTIDYYPASQKIFESHNRINVMECSKNRLWIGTQSGLTCLDLNTHLYTPYTVVANDPNILQERILQLSIDNVNHRLWIRTDSKLCIVHIEESTNTLHILDWQNDYDREITWNINKPVGRGGLWLNTEVKAQVPSDLYLFAFYDKKKLTLSHNETKTINFTVEIDPIGNNNFVEYNRFKVESGKTFNFHFPEGFHGRCIRFRVDADVNATAWLEYR